MAAKASGIFARSAADYNKKITMTVILKKDEKVAAAVVAAKLLNCYNTWAKAR